MLMGDMLRLVLGFCVLSSIVLTSSAQTCKNQTFSNKVFTTCRDLPQLTSYLHWTYEESSGKLDIAFRHAGITSTNRWVAWAINPNNNLDPAMIGAQALVAIPQSSGTPKVYTSNIVSTTTQLQEGKISYPVSGLSATYHNNEVTIFATLTLSNGTTSLVHVWQDGFLSSSDSTPQEHSHESSHQNSKEVLDLVSGTSQVSSGIGSRQRRRNTHGILNAISWGILMPTGAVIARYLKVFKSADPAWFYLHIICQVSAYIVGLSGFGTGFEAMGDYVGDRYKDWKHVYIGIIGALGGIAVFLEAYTWIIVLKRKKTENKTSHAVNGTNGYGSNL
ncbi:cytochrome b561 and DOMON domain-containing protein At4g17280-like isoform X2 [Cicer arietinum]|uniref:Cytochrome b561 and DOMON domain-containing protein At4g17280-like isoform X2 n=1 Tax=Cicer arietinum TaxID=3827 RepID=A0A1S3EEA0_CICAR|nr:cytochrome b561 and DOMON domain-containing protein At4g17280-like isoform X2 [Cicer arietinum]